MITLLTMFALYFLPTLVAHYRRHKSFGSILLLNLFLGWTVIGWVIALLWALSEPAQVMVLRPAAMGGYCTHCGAPASAAWVCGRCGARLSA
jgi:Superinfection immunity protein